MQDEYSELETKPKTADPQLVHLSSTSPNRTSPNETSRDMFGGPWLGVLIFIVIAIAMGWGLTQLFKGMADQTRQTLDAEQLDHSFDPDVTYILKRDLLLGVRAGGDVVIVPFKDDMPRDVPGRYTWPTAEQYADAPDAYRASHGLVGIINAGTRIQFVEVIDAPDNPQTHLLVKTRLLSGPDAQKAPVLGMHLESVDTDDKTGAKRYVPRAELFAIAEAKDGPIQSEDVNPALD